MKKVSTAVAKLSKNFSQPTLTIGLDLGDRNSGYCVLDEAGQIQLEQRVRTNAKALQEVFGAMPRSRIALEIGTHSPWISRLLGTEAGRAWRKERQEASDRCDREKAGGVAASSVGERRSVRTVAQQQPNDSGDSRVKTKPFQEEKRQKPKPSSGDCVNGLAQVPLCKSRTIGRQTDGSTG